MSEINDQPWNLTVSQNPMKTIGKTWFLASLSMTEHWTGNGEPVRLRAGTLGNIENVGIPCELHNRPALRAQIPLAGM